jgi:ribosomal protein S18 acetylase RimI-like enzyme
MSPVATKLLKKGTVLEVTLRGQLASVVSWNSFPSAKKGEPSVAEITLACTRPAFQKQGVGSHLMREFLSATAEQEGCTWRWVSASETATGFFGRCGFHRCR